LEEGYTVGDLSRLGYMPEYGIPRKILEVNLPKQHIKLHEWDWSEAEVMTVGDSFFNNGGGGLNPYLQDYIATTYDKSVVNISFGFYSTDPVRRLMVLLNANKVQESGVKWVILESVERSVHYRLLNVDFTENLSVREIERMAAKKPVFGKPKLVASINNINHKSFRQKILQYINPYSEDLNTYVYELEEAFFEKSKNMMLCFPGTVVQDVIFNDQECRRIVDNLNQLADRVKEQGAQLIFLPCVEKYHLYYPWIKKGKDVFTPKPQPWLEKMAEYDSKYIYVDTLKVLREALNTGVQDIYFTDDTHWTHRAWEVIIKELDFISKI
jgi:hypothetical protein